jgi:hypothetical protein
MNLQLSNKELLIKRRGRGFAFVVYKGIRVRVYRCYTGREGFKILPKLSHIIYRCPLMLSTVGHNWMKIKAGFTRGKINADIGAKDCASKTIY